MMQPIVVFDTNILFSATGWRGRPYRCVELARSGAVVGITCPELVDELAEKLETKFNFSAEMVNDTIADLLSFLQVISIPGNLSFIANDPDDDVVLECAVVGGADYIITGDRRHLLPIGNYQGIAIITAKDFLILMSAI